MDLTEIMTLISTVGFPIAACVALFLYMREENKAHRGQIDKFSESFDSNTEVMGKLLERMGEDVK